jgi:hypothetical protein
MENIDITVEEKVIHVEVSGGRGPAGESPSLKTLTLDFTHVGGTSSLNITGENNDTGLVLVYSLVNNGTFQITHPTWLNEYTPVFSVYINGQTISAVQMWFTENSLRVFLRSTQTNTYRLALILIPKI